MGETLETRLFILFISLFLFQIDVEEQTKIANYSVFSPSAFHLVASSKFLFGS